MKKILFSSIIYILVTACISLSATAQQIESGYYILRNARTTKNAMYVGQQQMPLGFVGTTDNINALQVCWRRSWTLPDKPDRETARYIFRIEQNVDSLYTIQNLAYGRYVKMPKAHFHACPTTTMPEETFEITPSKVLEGYHTLHSTSDLTSDSYLHASNDVNSVVKWDQNSNASQWSIIPVEETYAHEAFRIFDPLYESSVISSKQGHICEVPDVTPEVMIDSIISQYKGTPVFLFCWKKTDPSDDFYERNAKDYMEHALASFQIIRENGIKMVFITDENFPVYDWLEIVKTTEGDHYRLPSLTLHCSRDNNDYECAYIFYGADGNIKTRTWCTHFPIELTGIIEKMDSLNNSNDDDIEYYEILQFK